MIKTGPQGETAYVNQFYVVRNREVATKHVFAGGSRLVSQLAGQPDENGVITTPTAGNSGQVPWGWSNGNGNGNGNNNAGGTTFEADQYFYHPDHLGSSSYVTNIDGEIFQHVEYFPFGETFVEEQSNTQRTPYLFTGKELDEETGLYYFGARYYDPRTSVWQSPDPILSSYMGGGGNSGGVYTSANLNLYGYVHQRPITASDPSGEDLVLIEELMAEIMYHVLNMPSKEEYYDGTTNTITFHYDSVAAAQASLQAGNSTVVQMEYEDSILHMFGTDGNGKTFEGNVKFVDEATGKLEWVFTFEGGLVTDAVNKGTNNRVSPDDFIGHGIQDVIPWILWGTSPNDPSRLGERIMGLFGLGGYQGDVNMTS